MPHRNNVHRDWCPFPWLAIAASAIAAISLFFSITARNMPTDQPEPPQITATPEATIGGVTMAPADLVPLGPSAADDFRHDGVGNDLGGRSRVSPATTIIWAEADPNAAATLQGATPADVLRATARRLEHLQTTPQSSDRNARALWGILRALQDLEG